MRTALALVFVLGCGGASVARPPPVAVVDPNVPTPQARSQFEQAFSAFEAHERAGDWSPASCTEVAAAFDRVGIPVASFDAVVVHQRCGDQRLDDAISALDRVVRDQQFRDAEALTLLAKLRMKHGDLDAAKADLQRALAIQVGYMPALDGLATYYIATRRFDMAALVAQQAIERDATYAPIYNTAGLAQNAMGKTTLAVGFFQKAVERDPKLFEAQMNLASANLQFRGFVPAEKAFRAATALRPNDYDGHLGLALAVRGQIVAGEIGRIDEVKGELATCKRIDARRPDAYFNEAILAQEFETPASADPSATLGRSIALMNAFKERANGKTSYASAMKHADERIEDAKTAQSFLSR